MIQNQERQQMQCSKNYCIIELLHHNQSYQFRAQYLEVQIFLMLDKINTLVPYSSEITQSATSFYGYSKEKASEIICYSSEKAKSGEQCVRGYGEYLEKSIHSLIQKTANDIFLNVENAIGVEGSKSEVAELETYQKRIQAIFQRIFTGYLCFYGDDLRKRGLSLVEQGHEILLPFYVSLKATIIVSKEMIVEFLESRFNNVKLTYESSKDIFVMIISGNFSEEEIKKNLLEKVDNFKKLTVEVVQKGLEIKVDRQSLIENFSKFSEVVKQMKEKGEDNIHEVKTKSKNVYKEVIRRIKEKERAIIIQMKGIKGEDE